MLQQFWIINALLIPLIAVVECSWGSPGAGQYHIQTDEGPERYFRFQTDNGQFRKEKRLQDGTVIGTEAWIDAAGFLRQKDYIADKEGYRILKSKTIFVGQNRPIEDAIKSTKSVPAQSGILVDGSRRKQNQNAINTDDRKFTGYVYSTTARPFITSSKQATASIGAIPTAASEAAAEGKLNYLSPAEAAHIQPSPYLGFDHYPDETPRAHAFAHARQPAVFIKPHSEPTDDDNSQNINALGSDDYSYSSTARPFAAAPALRLEAPYQSTAHRRRLQPIAVFNTSPTPISGASSGSFSTPMPFTAWTPKYEYAAPSTVAPAIASSLDVDQLQNILLPPLPPASMKTRRLRPPSSASNALDYDGVSATRNGFRYFLPRQYHEEEQFAGEKRAGSYGYVDPFGIRRVVYYNASPERGFVHRNNNRYVGLEATPYDPPGPAN